MAYKKDIKPYLKETGYTWEDMDKFWEECVEVNWKCKMIADSGKSWSDLTMYQIKQLPTLKEKTLKQEQEKLEEEKRQADREKQAKEDKEYYENHFEEIMLEKIDSGLDLTERELSRIKEYSISTDYGDKDRWQRPVYDILKISDRYFSLTWYEGLTEYQEDTYLDQPVEVVPHKVITITEKIVYTAKDSPFKDNSEKDFGLIVEALSNNPRLLKKLKELVVREDD